MRVHVCEKFSTTCGYTGEEVVHACRFVREVDVLFEIWRINSSVMSSTNGFGRSALAILRLFMGGCLDANQAGISPGPTPMLCMRSGVLIFPPRTTTGDHSTPPPATNRDRPESNGFGSQSFLMICCRPERRRLPSARNEPQGWKET